MCLLLGRRGRGVGAHCAVRGLQILHVPFIFSHQNFNGVSLQASHQQGQVSSTTHFIS